MKNVGLGRIGYLREPIAIKEIISIMKKLLNQNNFRLALANGKTLSNNNNYNNNDNLIKLI